jgi:hypothetical protein
METETETWQTREFREALQELNEDLEKGFVLVFHNNCAPGGPLEEYAIRPEQGRFFECNLDGRKIRFPGEGAVIYGEMGWNAKNFVYSRKVRVEDFDASQLRRFTRGA